MSSLPRPVSDNSVIQSVAAPASRVTGDARLRARAAESDADTVRPRAVSVRAVILGLIFSAALCAFTPYNDFKIAATYIAGTQFPIGALFVLFVFSLGVNAVYYAVAPSKAFTRGELLTLWTMILVASGIPSSGMMRYFIPMVVYHRYASNDENGWEGKIWAKAPDWIKFQDKDAATAFFKGYPLGQEHIPWGAWVGPLAAWIPLSLLFLVATFCLTAILRKQWVANEKFSFPLVTLPILLAEEPEPGRKVNALLRTPLLWVAVVLVTVIHTVRGLHQMYPSVPDIQMDWNFGDFLTIRPWNQLGWLPGYIYPLVIGIAFLLPAEVCLSLWFFFFFFLAEKLLCIQMNWDMPGPQGYGDHLFHSMQAYGGGLALVGWTFWTGRRHFRDVWEKALGGPDAKNIDDSGELLSYRAALFGLLFAYGGITIWMSFAQVPIAITLLMLITLTLALVVISWVVCQAGMLFMAQPYGSIDVLSSIFGTAPFRTSDLFTLSRFESAFIYDTREMLAPSVLMGAKTADTGHFNPRPLMYAMVASVAVGFVVSLFASLYLPYYNGGGNSLKNEFMYHWAPERPLSFLGGVANLPFRGSWLNALHLATGLVGVLLLQFLRARYNFGLHPIGFLCASVYAIKMLWLSIFIGWVCKTLIARYGGMKGYLGAMPFFLGLILGDVINAVIWIVIGNLTGVGYAIMPG